MRKLGLVLVAIVTSACVEPARIELVTTLPAQVTTLAPIPLPKAIVKDVHGAVIDAEVEITTAPAGIVELRDQLLVPHRAGTVSVIWKTKNVKTASAPLAIRPVDQVELRCVPSCRVVTGDKISIQATAYGGGSPLLDVEVALTVSDPAIVALADDKLTGLKIGTSRIEARVGEHVASKVVEVRGRASAVDVNCPTIYTVTDTGDGKTMDVCYVTKTRTVTFAAHAMSGTEKMPDDRVTFSILNNHIADVASNGSVVGRNAGQTVLKVSLADSPWIYKQLSIYVDEPRALERLWRTRRVYRFWSYRTGYSYVREYYSPQCKEWKNFYTKAFVRVPQKAEPERITCESSEAVSCAAEAATALTLVGAASRESFRAWLGPCCCLTDTDREELANEEARKLGTR
jgi:hypothetical protein